MSDTLRNIRGSRQTMLVNKAFQDLVFLIVGVGGIGSNVAHMLASMGAKYIVVYDPDVVGEENIWPQFFNVSQIGMTKVEALAQNILASTGTEITAIPELYRGQYPQADVVVTGLDSMRERFIVWRRAESTQAEWSLWVDGRMGGLGCSAIFLDRQDEDSIDYYKQHMLDPTFSSGLACGEKSTAFITNYLSGIMCAAINSWAWGNSFPTMYHTDFEGGLWRTGEIKWETGE